MAQLKFAAVDLGAESGRVLIGDFDGERVQLEEAQRFPNVPVRALDTLYWDVLRLWNDIQDGLAKAAASHGAELSGIGVDTWGVDFGLLDANDALLGNPVHYRDKRNEGMMEVAFTTLSRQDIFDITGLQYLSFNTLFQLLALKKQNSPQLEIARTLLMMPDLLHFWLTGTKSSEYTIASTSQMLNAQSRTWDQDLLSRFELPTQILPSITAPGTVIGTVRASVAERTGITDQTPVIAPGSHDTASAVVAVPAEGNNWAYLSSGTWSLMGIELPEPLINDRVAELNFTNEGGVGNTIRFLKNIAGLWLVQECRRTWQRAGEEYSYAELTQRAAEAEPLQAFIEPDHPSFVAPAAMPQAIRECCQRTGQTPPDGIGATVRCCLESLALKYRWTLERLEELRGSRLEVLHIVGGGTQNKLLSHLTADCIQRPVIAGPVEATATGNILVQAMARGELSNLSDIRAVVRRSFSPETFEPDTQAAGHWDAAYEKYLSLLK
ncbi:MAG: rhamnulokinase [Abitibacteriaceae bacterium]|nr:rhamnulokinase [Abditibacteriaceae bacterium]